MAQTQQLRMFFRSESKTQPSLFKLPFQLIILFPHIDQIKIPVPCSHHRIFHKAYGFQHCSRNFQTSAGHDRIQDMRALIPAVHAQIQQQGKRRKQQKMLGRHGLSGNMLRKGYRTGTCFLPRKGLKTGSLTSEQYPGKSVNADVTKGAEIFQRSSCPHDDRGKRIIHHDDRQ